MAERLAGGRVRIWGMTGAIGLVVLGGCSIFPGGAPSDTETGPTRHRVVLEVIGDGVKKADIAYDSGEDSNEQQSEKLPWKETVTTKVLDGISVLAQNTGDAGTLTCTVTVDGRVWQKVTAEGEFALVSCDLGTAPTPTPTTSPTSG